jgi:pectinesterase
MNCTLGAHIVPAGWENWHNPANEKTARYAEYRNTGAGASTAGRVKWSRQLSPKESVNYTLTNVFARSDTFLVK